MVVVSAVLIVDHAITPDSREAVRTVVGDTIDDLAEVHDERRAEGERSRGLARLAAMVRDLREGVLKSTDLDLAAAFPPAPEGWDRRPYATADGEAITRAALVRTKLAVTQTNGVLLDFEKALEGKALTQALTYSDGTHLAALRLESSLEAIRRAEAGEAEAAWVPTPVARVDGMPVALHRHDAEAQDGRFKSPPAWRHFSVDLDGQVRIDLITDAPTDAALALLAGIDFAGLQADLPRRTAAYTPGAGVERDMATQ
jgi:hypothetical protein